MFQRLFGGISPQLAIDLGTANTLVYVPGKGIVANEPSFVAIHESGIDAGQVAAIGARAKELAGRTSDKIKSSSPLLNGLIHDFEHTQALLKFVLGKVPNRNSFIKSKAVIGLPAEATAVERRALIEAASLSGVGELYLVHESLVAALGAGLPVMEPCGSMIIDIGAGSTTASIISLGDIIHSETIQTAGSSLDRKIIEYVRRERHAVIGEQMAEQVKKEIGAARSTGERRKAEVQGRNLETCLPQNLTLTEDEIIKAIADPIESICLLIERMLEKTPPEIASDIVDRGMTLVGGGSLLRNFDLLISDRTTIPVNLVEDPMTTGVVGTGKILEKWDEFSSLATRASA